MPPFFFHFDRLLYIHFPLHSPSPHFSALLLFFPLFFYTISPARTHRTPKCIKYPPHVRRFVSGPSLSYSSHPAHFHHSHLLARRPTPFLMLVMMRPPMIAGVFFSPGLVWVSFPSFADWLAETLFPPLEIFQLIIPSRYRYALLSSISTSRTRLS